GGVTAVVLLPHELVVPAEHMAAGMLPPASDPEQDPAGDHGAYRDGAATADHGESPADREAALVPASRSEAVVPLRETEETGRFAALPADEPHRRRQRAQDGAGPAEAAPVEAVGLVE